MQFKRNHRSNLDHDYHKDKEKESSPLLKMLDSIMSKSITQKRGILVNEN
jgi:hypothetical protein